jgi:hypothetical protein
MEAKANPQQLAAVWPDDFVRSLDEAQREALFTALLGAGPEGAEALGEYIKTNVLGDVRRDEIRRRIWKLETEIVSRLAPEVQAFIAREPKGASTEKAYAVDQRRFAAFCDNMGLPALPPSAGVIAAFILAEHDIGVSFKIIQKRLSAIAAMYRDKGHVMPMKDRLVRVVMDHVRKAGQKKGTKDNGKAE